MGYDVWTRELFAERTATISATLAVDEIQRWLPAAYAEIYSRLGSQGTTPRGAPYARYTPCRPGWLEVEAGVPVDGVITPSGQMRPGVLPSGTAAVTLHVGSYERLGEALGAVDAWLGRHGVEPVGGHFELYLTGPDEVPDPAHARTELIRPFRPVREPARG